MIVTLQRLRPRVEYFGFSVSPRMLFVNTPIYVVVVVGAEGGGGSKYYDPDASPGTGPNRPPLDPLSRRGEIYLKTRGHLSGLLVQEVLRSRHSYKVGRPDGNQERFWCTVFRREPLK